MPFFAWLMWLVFLFGGFTPQGDARVDRRDDVVTYPHPPRLGHHR